MPVVPTRVHEARPPGTKVQAGGLGNVKRVYVRAQGDGAPTRALNVRTPHEYAAYARVCNGGERIRPELLQRVPEILVSQKFASPEFGYAMQRAAVSPYGRQRARKIICP